ncbi:hypothetical protein SAMD00019534_066190 [Acytostelium subglobosum LB1]|uniref:hypothetical protein n=1 Tax=Acytostelium subglobosum LB1 TaxID=1410327 RepID=UPI00064502CE|nr:hypothetical protein SAMD00019534_066190 [Acytostelium subglobosum LB1]GAM23444.1 hypothetical protein SAMD00019534_066190 [Acytostelium subglobosum LB1]|eukprot:XP_012753893.1 hypothetical protein SAMD00019534_066190 [Acytostelium subglobosum LB1]
MSEHQQQLQQQKAETADVASVTSQQQQVVDGLDCECDDLGIIENIAPLELETLEFIELSSPTNIYSCTHLNQVAAPSYAAAVNNSCLTNGQSGTLFVASRNNIMSITPIEDRRLGLQWLTNDIITPQLLSSPQTPNLSPSTSPSSTATSSNINKSNQNSSGGVATQQPASAAQNPPMNVMKSHMQRLPLSLKSRIPPMQMKQPTPGNMIGSAMPSGAPTSQQQTSPHIANQSPVSSGSTASTPGSSKSQQHLSNQPPEDIIVSIDSVLRNGKATIAMTVIHAAQQGSSRGRLSFHPCKPGQPSPPSSTSKAAQSIPLDFTPFHLTHPPYHPDSTANGAFLLSGSDERIHIYQPNEQHEYVEGDIGEHFPELVNIQSYVMRIDIRYHGNNRYVAVGCQNGLLQITITDLETKQQRTDSCYFDGPVQTLSLYTDRGTMESVANTPALGKMRSIPSTLLGNLAVHLASTNDTTQPPPQSSAPVHLVAGSIIGYVMVFRNIGESMLKEFEILDQSDSFNGVTCVDVFDIDGDGVNELLVGTYATELLVYKLRNTIIPSHSNNFNEQLSGLGHGMVHNQQIYTLTNHKHFSHPIQGILNCKLLNDGMHQSVVITMFGPNHQVRTRD